MELIELPERVMWTYMTLIEARVQTRYVSVSNLMTAQRNDLVLHRWKRFEQACKAEGIDPDSVKIMVCKVDDSTETLP